METTASSPTSHANAHHANAHAASHGAETSKHAAPSSNLDTPRADLDTQAAASHDSTARATLPKAPQAEAPQAEAPQAEAPHEIHGARFLSPLKITIRDLRGGDALSLEWHGGEDLRGWYRAQWENHRSGNVRVLVADLSGFPIAQVAIHWHGKPTHPLVPDLQSLRVFDAFRGLGLGTMLLDCAEKLVAQNGHAQLSLAVGVENPRARILYERRGFQVFGEAYNDEWTYRNARGEECKACETVFDMVKNLAPMESETAKSEIDGNETAENVARSGESSTRNR